MSVFGVLLRSPDQHHFQYTRATLDGLTVLELRKSVKSPICIGRCISTRTASVSTIQFALSALSSRRIGVISTRRYLTNIRTALTVSRPRAANSFKVDYMKVSLDGLSLPFSSSPGEPSLSAAAFAYLLENGMRELACTIHAERFRLHQRIEVDNEPANGNPRTWTCLRWVSKIYGRQCCRGLYLDSH